LRIGVKLTLWLILPLAALAVVIGYMYQQRSAELLREELSKEGRAIARVVQVAAEDYLRDRQLADLKLLVDRITGYERVLGMRLFDKGGTLTYQSATLDSFPFAHRGELRGVLADRGSREIHSAVGNQPTIGFIFPLLDNRRRLIGAAQVLQLESYMQEDSRATTRFILTLILAMVATTVAIVLLVTRLSIARPIEALVRSFREVGARDAPTRVPVRGSDELGRLAGEFNGMCERLEAARRSLEGEQERRQEAEQRLRNADRLASLGRLAAGLAHEIGTPLNVISGRTDALLRDFSGHEIVEKHLRIISTQIDRIVRIVRDMLDFARMKPPRRSPIRPDAALRTVLDLLELQLQERQVKLVYTSQPDLPVLMADEGQLQQVFLNLALNALDAMEEGGTLRVTAREAPAVDPRQPGTPQPCVIVAFEDTGAGIRPEDRDHVFDPFFTTKPTGKGSGLGLAVSYGIIEEHGGWFDLVSHRAQGTQVTVYLPIGAECSEAGAPPVHEVA
jgi:two-component system NtrC family sensor kinase